MDAALARIERLDRRFNAFTVVLDRRGAGRGRRARRRAGPRRDAGPLHGVPMAIKEELDVAGCVTTFGGEANSTPAAADGEVVRRLRAAGAVIVGKTTMPEFGSFPFTESESRGYHPATPGTSPARPAAPAAGRRPRSPPGWCRSASAATAAARSGCRRRSAGCSGSSPSAAGSPPPRTRTSGWALGIGRAAAPQRGRQRAGLRRDPRQPADRPLPGRRRRAVRRGRRGTRARPAAGRLVGQRCPRSVSGSTRSTPRPSGTRRLCSTDLGHDVREVDPHYPDPTWPSCRSSSPGSAPRPTRSSTTTGSSAGRARPTGSAPGYVPAVRRVGAPADRGLLGQGQPGLRRGRRAAQPGDRAPPAEARHRDGQGHGPLVAGLHPDGHLHGPVERRRQPRRLGALRRRRRRPAGRASSSSAGPTTRPPC